MSGTSSKFYLASIVLAWYFSNGSTILLNKYIFKVMEFQFPMSLTLIHMIMQSILALLTIQVLRLIEKVSIPGNIYLEKIVPISLFFCANILLGNVSLNYVPVSFMQTLKSLTPVFTAVLQYLFFGSILTRSAVTALIPATFGVALSAMTEMSFNLWGFLAAIFSCLFTGLKFVLSYALLGGKYKLDAVNLLLYMAPPSVMILLPAAAYIEGRGALHWAQAPERTQLDFIVLIVSAFVSFALNVTLFMVLKATSSVTVTIAGNLKTLLVIIVSIYMFKNPVQPLNAMGMVIALAGITWYGLIPVKWQTSGTLEIAEGKEIKEPMLKKDDDEAPEESEAAPDPVSVSKTT